MAAPELRHLTVLFLLARAAACSAAPQPLERWSPPEGASSLAREAQAFMESYAQDLRAGERARLAARYHPEGAYLVGEGSKRFLLPDSLRAIYRGPWEPPTSFEWRDLSYEVVGPDAVVVIGQFLWGENAERVRQYSYTALLLRRDGELFIRLENESAAPAATP